MADTRAGAVATDAHRRRQVRLSIAAESAIRRAWRLLDPANIDGTRQAWLLRMVQVITQFHGLSEREAVAYLARYRLAELGTDFGVVITPGLDVAVASGVLDAAGPQALKSRIAKGVPTPAAYMQVRGLMVAESRKLIMGGGRGVVRESARNDTRAIGWRRVSDGDPCTFCALLVGRGPAYTTEAAALAAGNGDPYHLHCGCTVEILYGPWEPTEAEQGYIDAYQDAAEAASAAGEPRTAANVLHRMRADGEFHDSPARRSAKADDESAV